MAARAKLEIGEKKHIVMRLVLEKVFPQQLGLPSPLFPLAAVSAKDKVF